MRRKVIFLDVDGTLTEPGSNEPPASALRAIRQARSRGYLVYLCTGRNLAMLSPLLRYGFDGFIGSSGGYIRCGEEVIYDCHMSEAQKRAVMDSLKKNGIFRTVECKEGAFTDEGFKVFLREHAHEGQNSELLRWREQIEASLDIRPMAEYKGQPVYKVVFMSPSAENLREPMALFGEEFMFCLQKEEAGGFLNGELVSRAFDKGKGLRRVCEHLQIPLEDSIAIGDSANDREMLETAGVSICMENGSEEMKKLADETCPPVAADGIWHAFERHHLV